MQHHTVIALSIFKSVENLLAEFFALVRLNVVWFSEISLHSVSKVSKHSVLC